MAEAAFQIRVLCDNISMLLLNVSHRGPFNFSFFVRNNINKINYTTFNIRKEASEVNKEENQSFNFTHLHSALDIFHVQQNTVRYFSSQSNHVNLGLQVFQILGSQSQSPLPKDNITAIYRYSLTASYGLDAAVQNAAGLQF
jgi:hypothetical protein